jgi:molybdenum cofactor synthesis domain-containing protein
VTAAPTASAVTVGTELVLGEVENANGAWLGRALTALGIEVVAILAVPDDVERIADCVRRERLRSDVVLVCGGLGGTPDDVTRPGIARAFGVELREDPALAAALRSARDYRAAFAGVWSRIPAGARPLVAGGGGAPGFRLENVVALPGVPSELRAMFAAIEPELARGDPLHVWRRTLPTSEHRVLRCLEELALHHGRVSAGSYPRFGVRGAAVEIVLRAVDRDALDAAAAVVERHAGALR